MIRDDISARDFEDIGRALSVAQARGAALFLPSGEYHLHEPLVNDPNAHVTLRGEGPTTRLVMHPGAGLSFQFEQSGFHQPHQATVRDLAIVARGECGTPVRVSYGTPNVTNDHNHHGALIADVSIESGPEGVFTGGIELESVWNSTLRNVFVSGDASGGNWNAMRGAGVQLKGLCLNTHLDNVRMNFWAEGLKVHADNGHNAEGIFCSNCGMVAVKRGVWVRGNPAYKSGDIPAPRIAGFGWQGGMIDARVGGVETGSAAFHFEHVWDVMISGCYMLAETTTLNVHPTYGVIAQECQRVQVVGCNVNSWIFGLCGTGECIDFVETANVFPGTLSPLAGEWR